MNRYINQKILSNLAHKATLCFAILISMTVIMVVVSSLAHGAESTELVISGPDTIKVSEVSSFYLDNLPQPDPSATSSQIVDHFRVLRTYILTAKDAKGNVRLMLQLGITPSGGAWGGELKVSSDKAGIVELVVVCEKPYLFANKRVIVGSDPTLPGPAPGPEDPSNPNLPPNHNKVTKITYVFEKDQNAVPRPVAKALQSIHVDSSLGIVATEFEEDSITGGKVTPDQYKIASDAAKKVGMPCLVVEANGVVVKTIKDPKTEEDVLNAIK